MSKYYFFWKGPLSNWAPAPYTSNILGNPVQVNCSEQAMMLLKAYLFKDNESFLKILETTSPKEQKRLGRLVKGFDPNVWEKVRFNYFKKALKGKFIQLQKFRDFLLNTGEGTLIVEASPLDCIWGIGLTAGDAKHVPEKDWPGLNVLGRILTEIRDEIINGDLTE